MRGFTIDVSTTLVTEECCNCHVLFAFPKELKDQLLEKRGPLGRRFYCPNGHDQFYLGKSEAEQLREKLAQVERERDVAKRSRDRLSAEVDQERTARAVADRRRAAYQGQVTKLRKHATAGMCAFCKRTFANYQRHMESKHPDESGAAPEG